MRTLKILIEFLKLKRKEIFNIKVLKAIYTLPLVILLIVFATAIIAGIIYLLGLAHFYIHSSSFWAIAFGGSLAYNRIDPISCIMHVGGTDLVVIYFGSLALLLLLSIVYKLIKWIKSNWRQATNIVDSKNEKIINVPYRSQRNNKIKSSSNITVSSMVIADREESLKLNPADKNAIIRTRKKK